MPKTKKKQPPWMTEEMPPEEMPMVPGKTRPAPKPPPKKKTKKKAPARK